jgi:hypothetical protein
LAEALVGFGDAVEASCTFAIKFAAGLAAAIGSTLPTVVGTFRLTGAAAYPTQFFVKATGGKVLTAILAL